MTLVQTLRHGIVALAAHAACMGAAMAQDVSWTGGAAAGAYWDLLDNWSGTWSGNDWGPGNYAYVRSPGKGLLGASDSTVRTATFAGRWQGTGTVTIADGGVLEINGDSSFGKLVLQEGGALAAPQVFSPAPTYAGRVDVQELAWQGGRLGGYQYDRSYLQVYAAQATLGNGLLGGLSKLVLTGDSAWQAGDAVLALGDAAELRIAAGATLRDDTAGSRRIDRVPYYYDGVQYFGDYMRLTNEGTYLKSAGDTMVNTSIFRNTGLVQVTGGTLSIATGVYYRNADEADKVVDAGRLDVSGGKLQVAGQYIRTGEVSVTGGRLELRATDVASTSSWRIGAGGTVQVGGSTAYHTDLKQASVHNDGLLQVTDGGRLALPRRVSGQGVVELKGGILDVDAGGQEIEGSLRMLHSGLPFDPEVPELTFVVSGAAGSPLLSLGGSAELDGLLTVNFLDLARPGSYLLLDATGGISGQFDAVHLTCGTSGLACDLRGYAWSLGYGNGQLLLSISAVPEPGVLVLTALGMGLAVLRRRAHAAS